MKKPRPRSFILLLSALTAVTSLSIDMSLPALPLLQEQFHSADGIVQLTLSLFLLGFAVGQLSCGPLSDRYGRRPLLLLGIGAYTLASLGCAFAPSLPALIALRFVQGIAGSFGPVLARAMVRDCYDQSQSVQVLSTITQVMVIAPLVAPTLGGLLLVHFGWQSIFQFLTVSGGLLWLMSWLAIAETRPAPEAGETPLPPFWSGLSRVAAHPATRRSALMTFFVSIGMFAYISASPFVIMEVFHVSKQHFGQVFSIVALALLVGASVNRRWLPTVGSPGLARRGIVCVAAGGLLMFVLVSTRTVGLAAIIGPMSLYIFGVGMLMPNITAAGMEPHGRLAGLASSFLGSMQTLGSAAAGYVVGWFYNGTAIPMASGVAIAGVMTLTVAIVWRGRAAIPASAGTAGRMALEKEYVE